MLEESGPHPPQPAPGRPPGSEQQPEQPPLCVVSHRLPISYEPDVGWQRSPGGLVSALEPVLRNRAGSIWLGHVARSSGAPPPAPGLTRFEPLWISEHEQRNAIDGFANRTLWPALHGLINHVEQLVDWWEAYAKRGVLTARRIAEVAEPGSLVWVHDYHHFNVASPLRRLRPDVTIGLFCHTPFDADAMGSLAHSQDLAAALRDFEHIGVQTERDARELRAFLREGDLREEGSGPSIAATPVGFDVERWLALRDDPIVVAGAGRAASAPGMLAVGVDRADYTKGLLHKLLAVDTLLEGGSIGPDELRLVQVAVPTRSAVPAYQALIDDLRHVATRINSCHVRRDGRPVVDLRIEQLSQREVAGLMRGADIALVTPSRDGMNLVALEYSVLNGDRPNGLVLGRGAGAAEHVGEWCELVDGTDVLSIAAGLRSAMRALTFRPEAMALTAGARQAAAAELRHDRWVEEFLGHLSSCALGGRRREGRLL